MIGKKEGTKNYTMLLNEFKDRKLILKKAFFIYNLFRATHVQEKYIQFFITNCKTFYIIF